MLLSQYILSHLVGLFDKFGLFWTCNNDRTSNDLPHTHTQREIPREGKGERKNLKRYKTMNCIVWVESMTSTKIDSRHYTHTMHTFKAPGTISICRPFHDKFPLLQLEMRAGNNAENNARSSFIQARKKCTKIECCCCCCARVRRIHYITHSYFYVVQFFAHPSYRWRWLTI